jgi:hypothetical protein
MSYFERHEVVFSDQTMMTGDMKRPSHVHMIGQISRTVAQIVVKLAVQSALTMDAFVND